MPQQVDRRGRRRGQLLRVLAVGGTGGVGRSSRRWAVQQVSLGRAVARQQGSSATGPGVAICSSGGRRVVARSRAATDGGDGNSAAGQAEHEQCRKRRLQQQGSSGAGLAEAGRDSDAAGDVGRSCRKGSLGDAASGARRLQVAAVLGCRWSGGGEPRETPAFEGEGVQPRRRTVSLLLFLFFSLSLLLSSHVYSLSVSLLLCTSLSSAKARPGFYSHKPLKTKEIFLFLVEVLNG